MVIRTRTSTVMASNSIKEIDWKERHRKKLGNCRSPRLSEAAPELPPRLIHAKASRKDIHLESNGVVSRMLLRVNHTKQNQELHMPHLS